MEISASAASQYTGFCRSAAATSSTVAAAAGPAVRIASTSAITTSRANAARLAGYRVPADWSSSGSSWMVMVPLSDSRSPVIAPPLSSTPVSA